MSRTKDEMWALCEKTGAEQAQSWIDGQSVRGIELGYVMQWIQHISDKDQQQKYNDEVLKQAKTSNTIAWFAAASVISALTAIVAVYLGNK